MDFMYEIKEETIIVGSSYLFNKIKESNRLLPIKYMSEKELISALTYTYEEDAIIYLMNKYNIKYDIAKTYLDNIIYVSKEIKDNPKLTWLYKIKNELLTNNLLKENVELKKYLKRTPIILYDINLSKFLKNILTGYNYKLIDRKYNIYPHKVIKFNTMEEEINYIAKEISFLILKGIDIKKIKLTNVDTSYYNDIERIFSYYNLKVNISRRAKLSSFKLVRKFLDLYDGVNLEECLQELKDDSSIYEKLIKVINANIKYDNKDLLIHKIKTTDITNNTYYEAIDIVDYFDYISNSDEYIFMLGMNDNTIPKLVKDIEYLTDKEKSILGLNTKDEINKYNWEQTINAINDIKNLTMTYKLTDNKNHYYPSSIVNNYEVINYEEDYKISYSSLSDKINLIKKYDEYYKFGTKNNNIDILRYNYKIPYNSYSHQFSGIKRKDANVLLSYSQMQNYNKCAFRYYLTNILKIDIYEENFSTIIGSMVHYVLENCLRNNDNDIEKYVNIYLKDKEFTKKETFFLEKYKEAIYELLKEIELEKEYSLFTDALYEKKINIPLADNIHFVGIIDKVLYYITDDTTYITLIDYKTGHNEISLKYLKYGLNIQLPIYLYLSTKLDFKNIKYCGFYLQKFNITEKDYRLIGYTNSNPNVASIIDKNYSSSKIIKGLKAKEDGEFYKTSKIVSDEDIDTIKKEVESIILDVSKKIKNNVFPINPKVINGKKIGCEYCKYKDICFMNSEDEVVLFDDTEKVGEEDELN